MNAYCIGLNPNLTPITSLNFSRFHHHKHLANASCFICQHRPWQIPRQQRPIRLIGPIGKNFSSTSQANRLCRPEAVTASEAIENQRRIDIVYGLRHRPGKIFIHSGHIV